MVEPILRGLFDPACASGLRELSLTSPGPVLRRAALTWAETPGESWRQPLSPAASLGHTLLERSLIGYFSVPVGLLSCQP